jgi:colanic acid biosynthesis protein WcaH
MYLEKSLLDSFIKSMPIVCVDAVIIYKDEYLVIKRTYWPAKDQFWLPGGRVWKNETIIDATLRKVKEETNLMASYENFLTVEETLFEREKDTKHTVNITSLLSVQTVNGFSLDDQHIEYKWLQENDPFINDLHPAVSNPIFCAIELRKNKSH